MLHLRLVRSAHAHGRLVSIEASAALALPGVAAVWTSADVAEIPPIDFRLTRIEGLAPYRQPILARERVRYVGEPVAAVFATDPYVAEDAADLVTIEVDDLPPLLDASAAPGEFEAGRSTEAALSAASSNTSETGGPLGREAVRATICARIPTMTTSPTNTHRQEA